MSTLRKLAVIGCLLAGTFSAGSLAGQAAPSHEGKDSFSKGGWLKDRDGHVGDWLRRFQNVPVAEQERALNNDPEFQKLPPEKQEKLRHRLREFNNLPPEKRQRILHRMEVFEHLSPEQQARTREVFRRLRTLPEERRRPVKRTARNLRQYDAAERQRLLESEPYRKSFTDEERALIRELSDLDFTPATEHPSETHKPE
ncbi:MAG: DUF3106 domain-containing protein [Acidobacteriales bacterium]|nr:DUF3106 domain-containing protein [Terriglobales bacterium]